jgi:hypothetical protein
MRSKGVVFTFSAKEDKKESCIAAFRAFASGYSVIWEGGKDTTPLFSIVSIIFMNSMQ